MILLRRRMDNRTRRLADSVQEVPSVVQERIGGEQESDQSRPVRVREAAAEGLREDEVNCGSAVAQQRARMDIGQLPSG